MINIAHAQLIQKFVIASVFLTGFAVGGGLVYLLAVPDLGETSTDVTTEVTTEMDYIHVDTLVRNEISSENLIKSVAAETFEKRYDSLREYTGTNKIQHGTITWTAKTGGILTDLDIATDIEVPVITNTIVQKETVTREVYRPSFYATGTVESDKTFSPGVSYVRKQWMVGYKYNLTGVNPAAKHSFTVGIRLK